MGARLEFIRRYQYNHSLCYCSQVAYSEGAERKPAPSSLVVFFLCVCVCVDPWMLCVD